MKPVGKITKREIVDYFNDTKKFSWTNTGRLIYSTILNEEDTKRLYSLIRDFQVNGILPKDDDCQMA